MYSAVYFGHAFKATTSLHYLMMTDNGNKNKLKGSCLFHFDQGCCCLLWFYMPDPQDSQTQSHAASYVPGSTEAEKVDSYWKSPGFSPCDGLLLPLCSISLHLTNTFLDIYCKKLANQAAVTS